jgi:hypothetical protein
MFITIGADPTLSSDDLHVFFHEVQVGNSGSITYQATADATVTYGCVDSSGNVVSSAEPFAAPVSAMVIISRNGSINVKAGSQELTIEQPGPGSFSCSGGLTLKLLSVSYTHLVLADITNGVCDRSLYNSVFTFP